ncbi:MAG: hypothetical protein Q9208_004118 [Pyrenodesmia sp. 3 TL-2023]
MVVFQLTNFRLFFFILPSPPYSRSFPTTPHPVVKLDPRDTPPPLHFSPATSERERSSTADTTPIGTPKTFDHIFPRRSDKERERERDLLPFHRRTLGFAGNTSSYVDSALLESDFEDSTFPLFQDTSAPDHDMNVATPPRQSPMSSRRHQTSNLTSALQSTTGNETRPTPAMSIGSSKGSYNGYAHRDSLSAGMAASGSHHGSGAQPISMNNANRERPRRESLAGSMVSGMSWGGVSVASWVRDEIIMQGSSPFHQQSPSFHSSSYIPKLEANFMKDFSCCSQTLDSLHELVQHYEENHAELLQLRNNANQTTTVPDSKAAIAANAATAVLQSAQQQPAQPTNPMQSDQTSIPSQIPSNPVTPKIQKAQPARTNDYRASQHHPSLDMDAVQDMEMDDVDYSQQMTETTQNNWGMPSQSRLMQRSQFGQPASSRIPPLDTSVLGMGNHLQQHQGLRHSTPTTPVAASRSGNLYHNNPTVSSVNTPTLTAHPVQQQTYMPTPDNSAPGSPGEMEADYAGNMGAMDATMNMGNDQDLLQNQYGNFSNFQFGNGNEMLDLCIDEPAKRLFSANGVYNSNSASNVTSNSKSNQLSNAIRLGDAQYSENSELAKTIREQQRLAGIPEGGSGPNDGVPKPFMCPVIGCEKAYKNQNGLKYHKAHGHNNQQLHANGDGTFSIVDPETLIPYSGTLGMEKHKPYRCDACGKRYKNLNGLKYHKSHSKACEDGKPIEVIETLTSAKKSKAPKVPQAGIGTAGASAKGKGAPVNTNNGLPPAGGLPGIDEEMIM